MRGSEGTVSLYNQKQIFNFGKLKRIMGTLIGHGRLLERILKFLPKSVKQSIVNHGLIRNVQNWLIKGSRLNHSGCRTHVK
jgi:hypothetical protein